LLSVRRYSYDTYTPTRNIVFHDYGPQENGHGNNEWFKHMRDRFRKAAIERVKTTLQMEGGDTSKTAQANLGIYGLGKRRSIQQLEEFTNMDFKTLQGNVGTSMRCSGASWVPFDESISPVDNMYGNPDNLDPQPEFPLRTELVYYQQVVESVTQFDLDLDARIDQHADAFPQYETGMTQPKPSLPPLSLLFVLWVFGLMVWCAVFYNTTGQAARPRKKSLDPEGSKDV
jgi:hypothetical protein